MDLTVLETFVEVARRGSFAAVARTTNVDPSLVSRAIAGLESELGVRLLQRTTRRMTLTEAGTHYLSRVAAVVEELAQARDEARAISAEPRGTLRLTASVGLGKTCIVPLVGDFRVAYPEVRLEFMLSDDNLDLVAEGMDLAIRLAPSISADVICTRLFTTRYRVCVSDGYLASAAPLDVPTDLTAHDALLFALRGYQGRWLFRDRAGVVSEVPIAGSIVMSNALALHDCMLAGLGPALLADWLVADDLRTGRCVDAFPDHDVAGTSFDTGAWLIYPSRSFLPAKVRAAVDFFKARLGQGQRVLGQA